MLATYGHFFLLCAFFALRVVFSIKKSSAFFPSLIAATSQRGFAPRPAHSSPDGPLNFGRPSSPLSFHALPAPPCHRLMQQSFRVPPTAFRGWSDSRSTLHQLDCVGPRVLGN